MLDLEDGWARDRVNNVELIVIPVGVYTPTGPSFRINVEAVVHAASATYPTQSFSVYAWNVQCVAVNSTQCVNP